MGLATYISEGEFHTIIGLIGDTSKVDIGLLESLSIIETVKRISERLKKPTASFIRSRPSSTCRASKSAADISRLSRGRAPWSRATRS
jgi:hypothetical protein